MGLSIGEPLRARGPVVYHSDWPMATAVRSLIPLHYEPFTPEFFMPTKSKNNDRRPGGRPPKPDKDQWGQITCVLRHDTIERLREGADSKHFGDFLQAHLDRYPPPT